MSRSCCFVFAGPTLYADAGHAPPVPASARLLPPVRRGDVLALVRANPPGALAVVDGLFHAHLAVGHEELRDALQAGWRMWGLSSMGAIRAYEMRHLGMQGFGQVYAHFAGEYNFEGESEFECSGDTDFQDDEVVLLHAPDPPYRAVSEPLVHLRAALHGLKQRGLIPADACAAIAAHLKTLWYGDRSLRLFTELVTQATPPPMLPDAYALLADFAPYRLKTRDLEAFLQVQPWRETTPVPVSACREA